MKQYGKTVTALISAWFLFALVGSALQLFRNGSERIGVAVAIGASVPLVTFALWFGISRTFREWTLSLNPQVLTFAQTWRVLGLVFVLLEARNRLPAVFALPAGYGDIFIGITAATVAFKLATPEHRSTFMLWQVLGITDLVFAVGLGTTARLLDAHGASMLPMTVLPLSLVPTFLVPLFLMFHVICIAQARRWQSAVGHDRQASTPLRAY